MMKTMGTAIAVGMPTKTARISARTMKSGKARLVKLESAVEII
jgi:hypothetical protein